MQHHFVLKIIARLLLPLILLFALYVQFHGDFGPGGGFQAGVIFAVAFVLYGLVFGVDRARKVVSPALLRTLIASGLLLYAGVGLMGIMLGGNYLDYGVLHESPVAGQHLGIMLVELGVGVTVSSVMMSLFYAFTS